MSGTAALSPRHGEMITLWVLLGVSFAAAFAPAGIPGGLSLLLGWVPVVFVFWHFIRWAGAFTALWSFVVIVVVSFSAEALGVATGLVFGNYYYPDGPLGPLVLGVPPLIQLQYFAMAYSAIMIARAVSGSLTSLVTGWRLVAVSAMAAFAQTLLDVVADPWHATVLQPLTGEAKTIADAMVIIAMFAVAPLWVARLLSLRRTYARHRLDTPVLCTES